MRMRCRPNGVNSNIQITKSTILESDWTGNSGCQLTVSLAFGGTRTNCRPADQISNILRADQVQKFGSSRHADIIQIQQQFAGKPQTLVDMETVIKIRIIDQSFPTDGGARLFKINAHDDFQLILEFMAEMIQTRSILQRSIHIMDRARATDDQQPVILTTQNTVARLSCLKNNLRCLFVEWIFTVQLYWWCQLVHTNDAQIVSLIFHNNSLIF